MRNIPRNLRSIWTAFALAALLCSFSLPESEKQLTLADPYVLSWEGKYYAYGTEGQGFYAYVSEDLKHWTRSEDKALKPGDVWGNKWFWAPEVYFIKEKGLFYLFYSAEEHICVATSTHPEGPFTQTEKRPIVPDEKSIDASLFIDDDGKAYLYYVRFTDGNVIWVAEMNDDLTGIRRETLTPCITAEKKWELHQGKVAEGPSVMKQGDTYYLLYSANHFESKDYAVGYATSKSPMGPWKKHKGNPILRRGKKAARTTDSNGQLTPLVGTGHGAPFRCADGSYRYIFHAHENGQKVGNRRSYIAPLRISRKGIISIKGETIRPVVVR